MTLSLPRKCKILIIKPSALGDIVHTLPFLAAIKVRYPEAEVHWVVAENLYPFLEGHPLVDRFWLFNKQAWKRPGELKKNFPEIRAFCKGLRSVGFDVAVDLSGLFRSAVIAWLSGAESRIGFDNGSEGSPLFYTHKVHADMTTHAIERLLEVAAFLDCVEREVQYPLAPFDPEPAVCHDLPERFCIMVPSAGKEANRWPAERYGQLAAKLSIPSVLLGGAADKAVLDEVVDHGAGKVISLAGKTGLKELVPVISRASFMVANDTGPAHIAAACRVPVFAIFGPANPLRTGPYGAIHSIISLGLECAPCYAWEPCKKHQWDCMRKLSVDHVYAVVAEKIKRAESLAL